MRARNIDEVLEILETIVADATAAGDRLGFFAALYRQVTLDVRKGIQNGFFADGPRMDRLDATFASRYFTAYQAWKAGGETTRSWKVAFTAMESPDRIILQDLLVGINAHINLDLGIAAAETCPGEEIAGLQGDFFKINAILGNLIQPVETVIGQFSPLISLLERIGGKEASEVLGFSMTAARDDAWRHAVMLANLPPGLWPLTIDALDAKVAFLGRLIANPTGIVGKAVELIRMAESNDVPAIIGALDSIVQ